MERRIHRSRTDRVLAGVASGLAKHFSTDPVLIRVLFVALAFVGGGGILVYIIMWAIIPEEPIQVYGNQNFTTGETEAAGEPSSSEVVASTESNQTGSIIAGIILISLGALFLADEFLPKFDFGKYWPVLLVAIGIALLVTSGKRKKD